MRVVAGILSALLVGFVGAALAAIQLPAPKAIATRHPKTTTYQLPQPSATATHSEQTQLEPYPYHPLGSYALPYQPELLPKPQITHITPKKLSLRDAILLALRNNPDVKSSELTRITDKYAVMLAHWEFEPQYSFSTEASFNNLGNPTYSLNPGVNLKTPIGTTLNLSYTNSLDGGAIGTATITQPLLKGFGAVNLIGYENAMDGEETAKLTFKNSIITAVIAVIKNYRSLVEDYNNLDIQRRTLKEVQQQVHQAKISVKAGKLAPSELVQQQVTLETTRLALVQEENSLQTNYQTFLSSIGLIPNAKLIIKRDIDFKVYKLPDEKALTSLALANNIDYQQSVIQLRATKRGIFSAEDARKWQLNMTATGSVVKSEGAFVSGANQFSVNGIPINMTGMDGSGTTVVNFGNGLSGNGESQVNTSLMFNLNIPIDDLQTKADLVNSKVAYEQARLALEQKKEDLIRNVMTQLETVKNQLQQVRISERTVKLQKQNLKASQIKFKYGKSTAFEVTQIQDQLLQQETSLVGSKIQYLNNVTDLYQTLGITLDKWDVQLRY